MENSAGDRPRDGAGVIPPSRFPGGMGRGMGIGSGAAPRIPAPGGAFVAGLDPGEAQEESAERVKHGGAAGRAQRVPEVAARVWLYLPLVYFFPILFSTWLFGGRLAEVAVGKAAPGAAPAGPPGCAPARAGPGAAGTAWGEAPGSAGSARAELPWGSAVS